MRWCAGFDCMLWPRSPTPPPYTARLPCSVRSRDSAVEFANKLSELSLTRADQVCDPNDLRACAREFKRREAKIATLSRLPDTNFSCPICRNGCRILVMDGNFKLFQYASAAEKGAGLEPVAFPLPGAVGALFDSPERVAAVLQVLAECCYKLRSTCGPAEIDAMAGKAHTNRCDFSVDGTYCACCMHGILFKAFDFTGGEKASFPLAMYLLCQQPADVLVGDSLCRCHNVFNSAEDHRANIVAQLPEGMAMLPMRVPLAVNALHVRGVSAGARTPSAAVLALIHRRSRRPHRSLRRPPSHLAPPSTWSARGCRAHIRDHIMQHCFQCRVMNSIRNTPSVGLCHGETCEQVRAAQCRVVRAAEVVAVCVCCVCEPMLAASSPFPLDMGRARICQPTSLSP